MEMNDATYHALEVLAEHFNLDGGKYDPVTDRFAPWGRMVPDVTEEEWEERTFDVNDIDELIQAIENSQ